MKTAAAFSLVLALVIPFAAHPELSNEPYGVTVDHWLGHHPTDMRSRDVLAIGLTPSVENTCRCWSCPWTGGYTARHRTAILTANGCYFRVKAPDLKNVATNRMEGGKKRREMI